MENIARILSLSGGGRSQKVSKGKWCLNGDVKVSGVKQGKEASRVVWGRRIWMWKMDVPAYLGKLTAS